MSKVVKTLDKEKIFEEFAQYALTLFVVLALRNITWTLQVLLNIAPKPKLNPIIAIHNSN